MSKLKDIGRIGLAIAGAIVPGVGQIEAIIKALPGLKGPQKQDALVQLVKHSLETAEGLTDKDLLDDAEVEAATRAVIDAVVHLDNVVELKRRARTAPPVATTGE